MVTTQAKMAAAHDALRSALYERDEEARALMCAMIAGRHAVLLGPPGTAKSLLVECCAKLFSDARYFWMLMTRFSTPDEVWGPIDIARLKAGEMARVTDGHLAEAEIAFLDECFKANSGILNSLLAALNEGTFRNGRTVAQIPLRFAVGASNEMPESEELGALWDRLMVRLWVSDTRKPSTRRELLRHGAGPGARTSASQTVGVVPATLTIADLDAARIEAESIGITESLCECIEALAAACVEEVGRISDRTMVRCVRLVQASAYLRGVTEADASDLWILAHVYWQTPDQREKVATVVNKFTVGERAAKAREYADAAIAAAEAVRDGMGIREAVPYMTTIEEAAAKCRGLMAQAAPHEYETIERAVEELTEARTAVMDRCARRAL